MKLGNLLEMALPVAPAAKSQRLKAALTPENIASHYDLIIDLIGGKYSIAEIDEIVATIKGEKLEGQDLEFYMDMIGKKLPADTNPKRRTHGKFEAWFGILKPWQPPTRVSYSADEKRRFYEIGYRNGKWFTYFTANFNGAQSRTKKFDEPTKALEHCLKMIDKWQKDTTLA